jgi:uncharacterized membrane protein YqhA
VNEERSSPSPAEVAVERALTVARAIVLLPVAVLAIAALGAFVYGTYVFADSVRLIAEHPTPVGTHIGLFLRVTDLFLVGATLLIAAIAFYELFVRSPGTSESPHMPRWLQIDDLNDLKARVISMIVLVAAVTFVETLVDAGPGTQILDLGGGIAAVIVALTVFVRLGEGSRRRG